MAERRPLLYRPEQRSGLQVLQNNPSVNLIGLELRVRDGLTGQTEELELLPLDWNLPIVQGYGAGTTLPCTLHTSKGDLGFVIDLRPVGL